MQSQDEPIRKSERLVSPRTGEVRSFAQEFLWPEIGDDLLRTSQTSLNDLSSNRQHAESPETTGLSALHLSRHEQCKLPNGVNLHFVPVSGSPSLALQISVPAGSGVEDPFHRGASHFLEHLLMRTLLARSPENKASIRALGAAAQAFRSGTTQEETSYSWNGPSDKAPEAARLLARMLAAADFSGSGFSAEAKTVIHEIKRRENTPAYRISQIFHEQMYGDSPLAQPVCGKVDSIKALTPEILKDFKRRFYDSSSLVVACAGDLPQEVKNEIALLFSELQSSPELNQGSGVQPAGAEPSSEKLRLETWHGELAWLEVGFPALAVNDPRRPALMLVDLIMCGAPFSRLFEAVRNDHGLVYEINSGWAAFRNFGHWSIKAETLASDAKEVLHRIAQCLRSVRADGIGEDELSAAKSIYASHIEALAKSAANAANIVARQALLSETIASPAETIARLQSVSMKEATDLVRDLFKPEKVQIVILGRVPTDDYLSLWFDS